jgi:hypothetical protein
LLVIPYALSDSACTFGTTSIRELLDKDGGLCCLILNGFKKEKTNENKNTDYPFNGDRNGL